MDHQEANPAADGARSSPVDDVTYDLLQALTSKLEAIEAFQMYAEDGSETAELFGQLAANDRAQAAALLEALRDRLQR